MNDHHGRILSYEYKLINGYLNTKVTVTTNISATHQNYNLLGNNRQQQQKSSSLLSAAKDTFNKMDFSDFFFQFFVLINVFALTLVFLTFLFNFCVCFSFIC